MWALVVEMWLGLSIVWRFASAVHRLWGMVDAGLPNRMNERQVVCERGSTRTAATCQALQHGFSEESCCERG
ncbi:MAG: hypothetical protein CL862_09815 [Cyanobium sp. NAT70]|nr:hypothetical protein [Cyanobium sp. NAT70]